MFYKKTVLKISVKIHRNRPVLGCLFNKVEERCSFDNKIPTQVFPFEFWDFLKQPNFLIACSGVVL